MSRTQAKFHRLAGFVPACICGALVASSPALADMLDSSAMEPWETCALCHGTNGISATGKFPYLAGQKQAYLAAQLRAFQNGQRTNDGGQMRAISESLDTDEVAAATAYFAGLPAPVQSSDTSAIQSTGAMIYFNGRTGVPACVSCHGESGSNAPWLDSQHPDYLTKQLLEFANGTRRPAIEPAMSRIAAALTHAEIKALAEFLATARLRPHFAVSDKGSRH